MDKNSTLQKKPGTIPESLQDFTAAEAAHLGQLRSAAVTSSPWTKSCCHQQQWWSPAQDENQLVTTTHSDVYIYI